jgi:beta-galactosidase
MTISGISDHDREIAHAAYRALNDSPMQRKLRAEKRWYIGAVYWRPGDYDLDDMRSELRRMKALGFNIVRFHTHNPEQVGPGVYNFSRTDDWMNLAAEVGLPVISGPRGRVSDETLAKHGLSREDYELSHYDDPRVIAAIEETIAPVIERYREHPALYMWGVGGEPNAGARELSDYDKAKFGEWLRDKYGSIDALDRAWALYPEQGKPIVPSFEEAWRYFETGGERSFYGTHKDYGATRDLMRYQTDKELDRARAMVQLIRKYDSEHPILNGTHQLFLNQAAMRWDFGGWARAGDHFETSIHLSWHFELSKGEVDRSVFYQARATRDYFKDGWTSAFETTGGPVQYSGGFGNAMTAGLMRRLTLSYLAAGNVNIAFWTWNARPGGWEAGEYGMTSLSGALTPWALEAGKVAQGMAQYHEELWEAENETRVGILQSWDTEVVCALEPQRFDLQDGLSDFSSGTKTQPRRAHLGIARALTNGHVPFEIVTSEEIMEGIAAVYPVIYVPHARAMSVELLQELKAYVEKGGLLIADVQVAFEDPWGKLHPAGPGGPQEQLFGAYVDTIHDTRTGGVSLNATPIEGFYGDLIPTKAKVLARFDNGRAAITEVQRGRGKAILIGFDAARMCWLPGQSEVERLLNQLVWDDQRPSWTCDAPLAFRRTMASADHYFLLNDGPDRDVLLRVYDHAYASGELVLDAKTIAVDGTISIHLPGESAVWARFERLT